MASKKETKKKGKKGPSKKAPNKWVKVTGSGIHQKGLFAKRKIPTGTRFIEYVGEKITKKESERRGHEHDDEGRPTGDGTVYIFTLNSRYDIDGAVSWNKAKYANHSCEPNAYVEIKKNHIWIIAERDIKNGEEITYDYNFDIEHYEDHPCRCGAKHCAGYIVGEEFRKKLKRRLKAKKSRAKKKAGKKK